LPTGADVEAISIRTSHPEWIVETLIANFGRPDAIATLELNDEPPPVTLRINTRKTTVDAAEAELHGAGVEVERGALVPDALLVRHTGDLAALAIIRDGRATPQDQTSQAIVALLDPQPRELMLDLAAAPGGKATAAAERMDGSGRIIAADLHAGRVRTVWRAAVRVRHDDMIIPIVADGRRPPVRREAFDRVLLDAPCSGLGVLRRRPDARWRISRDDIDDLVAIQQRLLAASAPLVKPGGTLVYSVCTITAAESIEHPTPPGFDVITDAPDDPWQPFGTGFRLLPQDADTDGMVIIRYRARS
jgi:16S rRNA (cytosine967-C5)-methyltransferase